MDGEKSGNETDIGAAQLACLLASLNEVQQTIRSYDSKAQIMGVGFIFSVTMISGFLGNLEIERDYGFGYLIVGFALLIGPVTLYGSVLYPTRRTAPAILQDALPVHHCFYFRSDSGKDHKTFRQEIESANWSSELSYEIMRLSALRDLKRKRFLSAMFASGVSFAVILLGNIAGLSGLN